MKTWSLGLVFAASALAQDALAAPRWTAETPDEMIELAKQRALISKRNDDQVAALLTMVTLAEQGSHGAAERALLSLVSVLPADLAAEASLLARAVAKRDPPEETLGVVRALALLGPLRDTGGGLDTHDGPEASGVVFGDRRTSYRWGVFEVGWREVPSSFVSARGVPLGPFVHPRRESCSWMATKVVLPAPSALVLRVAAAGQVRLVFDGHDVVRSDEAHGAAWLDRLAAEVDASAGPHVIAAKVCSGPLGDIGRIRLRVTGSDGRGLGVPYSADLSGVEFGRKAPKMRPLATPLERALAPRTLAAAAVRTLGGADDLRSPRASGILSSFVASTEVDADGLAAAAWLAPTGSMRSGWLELARVRAESDPKAKAFVVRRRILQHLQSRLVDWAMAARRAARLDQAVDADAQLLAAKIDAELGPDTVRIAVVRRLEPWLAKPDVSTALLSTLAELAATVDVRVALKARQRLAERGGVDAAFVEAHESVGRDAVLGAARVAMEAMDDTDDGLRIARSVARTGAHEAARGAFDTLRKWSPNRAEAWAGFATELSATRGPDDPEAEQAITSALRRARELAPSEARYRAELLLRRRSQDVRRDDERYLVASQTVLERRQGVPPSPPEVADRELHWLRAVVLHDDRRVSQLIHYARELVIAPRTQDELIEELPSEGDLTEIVRARVHRRDGSVAFPTEERSDGTRPRIRWPELVAGDTVEVALRTWTDGAVGGRGDPPFYFLDYAGALSTHPLLYNEVIVESPPDRQLFVDVVGGVAQRREERIERGRKVVRLVWDKPATVADEPLSPAVSELVPMVVGSTFRDWSAFRGWYNEAVRGFTEPDDEVRQLARSLTRGKRSRNEKIAALFEFVADKIRYVNYQSAEAWLPNRPQHVLARREGDCDDKAVLLITLLRALGIEAEEVLVQTRLTGQPSIVRARGAAVPLFDHGIAYLPSAGLYLDATSPQSRMGPLPSMDARAVALRIAGPMEIVELPASSPADHGVSATWILTLATDGAADLVADERHVGDSAFWLRTNLTEPEARAQYIEEQLVGGWLSGVSVERSVEFQGGLVNGAAQLRYRAHSEGFARKEQGELVVPLGPSVSLASQLAPLVRRTLPVVLPPTVAPMHDARVLRLVAPKGFRWGAVPVGGEVMGGEFGQAKLEAVREGRVLVVRRRVVFDRSVIPVEQYGAWRAFVQSVDGLLHKTARLVPEEGR